MSRISEVVAAASDIESEVVHVDKWGVDIELRGMDGHARNDYLTRLVAAREEGDAVQIAEVEADLVVACAFDPENNERAFEPSDVPMLLSKSGAIIGMLSVKAQRLSGLDKEAEERLGKPSSASATSAADATPVVTTPSDASTSILPANSE